MSSIFLWVVVGFVVGGVVVWLQAQSARSAAQASLAGKDAELIAAQQKIKEREETLELRDRELGEERGACKAASQKAAELGAQLLAEQKHSVEKIEALINVENSLKLSFEALAAKALGSNSERFMQIAKGELEKQQAAAATKLDEKQVAIDNLLAPMRDSLAKISTHSNELELKREGAYAAVESAIKTIQDSHVQLRKETNQLVSALRSPKARGNWGEMQLRKCVEFAGMVEHASFDVEKYVKGDDAAIRPDLIVKLPNGRSIIVDAKTPLDAFLDANNSEDESQRAVHLAAHAVRVRKHLDALCGKAYWKQFPESPDFVLCFLPSEVLFSAALEQDPSLLEYSAQCKVLLVTPTTLIGLLKAVYYGWEQSKIARDASLIRDEALKIHGKLLLLHDAIFDLGNKLRGAGKAYDDMLTRVEGNGGIFSIARRLRDLKIGEKDLPESKPAALQLKTLVSDDWQPSLSLAASSDEPQ